MIKRATNHQKYGATSLSTIPTIATIIKSESNKIFQHQQPMIHHQLYQFTAYICLPSPQRLALAFSDGAAQNASVTKTGHTQSGGSWGTRVKEW